MAVAALLSASWLTLCHSCRSSSHETEVREYDDVQVDDDRAGCAKPPGVKSVFPPAGGLPVMSSSPTTGAPQEECVQICPVSGLSTLEGVCPFAKPKNSRKGKDEAKAKLKLNLDFQSEEEGRSLIRIVVRPRLREHFEALDLPCDASKEDVRKQYRKLALLHHPDKNSDTEAARERFQRIEKAYQAVKDTDGELGFPWDEFPDGQRVMTGEETVRTLAKLGMEAWDRHHLEAVQLRHMVRQCPEVRLVIRTQDSGADSAYRAECWVDALCVDPSSSSEHVVKLYRWESDPAAKECYTFAAEARQAESEERSDAAN